MDRRNFLKFVGAVAATATLPDLVFCASEPDPQKPNFVFILIDDMGWRDAGCYGSKFYETPNIDRLASEAMRFTDAYAACPVCSPTRASIMTGKYPARLGLTDWLGADKWHAKGKLQTPVVPQQMPLEEVTIAEALKSVGYATASIGKWHLGDQPYLPENQGFDLNIGGSNLGFPPSYFCPYKSKNFSIDKLSGCKEGEYLTDRLTDEALKFIETNKDKSFFVYLSHYAVHVPLGSKKTFEEKYEAKASKITSPGREHFGKEGTRKVNLIQDNATYAGMMQSVDESVGRVLEKLQELNLSDNTVVIFMSDNGGVATSEGWPTSNVPLRAGKGWLYEGGIREPMIIKWPGVTKPGSVCGEPVISTDFYPTMLEMAGLPLHPQQHSDGLSIVPLLKQQGSLKRDAIYWHYPHYSNQGSAPASAIRADDYKLIKFYEDNHVELYNLKNDISETADLADKMPEKTAELKNKLADWLKQMNAKFPTVKSEKEGK
jgi:arylsulfatase A-like enzyme